MELSGTPTLSTWQDETARYLPRVDFLGAPLRPVLAAYDGLPLGSLDYQPGVRAHVSMRVVLFNFGAIYIADQLVRAIRRQWEEGMFVGVTLPVRLIFEHWGALTFAREIVRELSSKEDPARAAERCERLTAGSRVPIRGFGGALTAVRSYSVFEFVRLLDEHAPGSLDMYEFLCEACHPGFIQQTYFFMASQAGDNWSNDAFKAHAHQLLDRTLTAAQDAVAGIVDETDRIAELARPMIEADRAPGGAKR
jgi:hypothetical protein